MSSERIKNIREHLETIHKNETFAHGRTPTRTMLFQPYNKMRQQYNNVSFKIQQKNFN